MLKIRLSDRGSKNSRFFKVVVAETRSKRAGNPVEIVGWWEPVKKTFKLDTQRIMYWVSQGAKPTKALQALIQEK